MKKTRIALAVAAMALSLTSTAFADPTSEARNLLNWCLAHPDACSISIDYAKNGREWHIDYNGTRLNVLASTIKVVHLMAYADAVDQHRINPQRAVDLDDWGRFWVGRDGGALAAAYTRLSAGKTPPPRTVTNDQIVSAMIQNSDNAAPDYLLNQLGSDFLAKTIASHIAGPRRVGYIDLPKSIGADFISWWGNPASPGSGSAILQNYSGFATDGYRNQLDELFESMRSDSYMRAIRLYNGIVLPWESDDVGRPGHGNPLSESQYEQLEKQFSMRSNTRTYNQFMLGLLRRDLLTPNAQTVVEGFLEYKLNTGITIPGLGGPLNQFFTRYGVKDGDFTTNGGAVIRTRTIYAQEKDGTQVVFTVHLNGVPGSATDLGPLNGSPGSLDFAISNFAIAMATNAAFATEVQGTLGLHADSPSPNLMARVVENKSTSGRVRLGVVITNIGTAPTHQTLSMGLFVSGHEVDQKPFPPLAPGASAEVDLDSGNLGVILNFQLWIDHANLLLASQKQDNPQFEINQGQ
jgi:hypothetical protein